MEPWQLIHSHQHITQMSNKCLLLWATEIWGFRGMTAKLTSINPPAHFSPNLHFQTYMALQLHRTPHTLGTLEASPFPSHRALHVLFSKLTLLVPNLQQTSLSRFFQLAQNPTHIWNLCECLGLKWCVLPWNSMFMLCVTLYILLIIKSAIYWAHNRYQVLIFYQLH